MCSASQETKIKNTRKLAASKMKLCSLLRSVFLRQTDRIPSFLQKSHELIEVENAVFIRVVLRHQLLDLALLQPRHLRELRHLSTVKDRRQVVLVNSTSVVRVELLEHLPDVVVRQCNLGDLSTESGQTLQGSF